MKKLESLYVYDIHLPTLSDKSALLKLMGFDASLLTCKIKTKTKFSKIIALTNNLLFAFPYSHF